MPRLTARDFAPELLELYDGYVHGRISRRQFLDRAGIFAVGGLTAAGLLAALSPDYALAQQVQFTDPEIVAEYIRYPSPNGHGEVRGYLVRPARAEGPLPGVVVVHENRGLNPYIEDVARRLATEGFLAFAPDGLFPVGGYPGNDDDGRSLQAGLDQTRLRTDLLNSARFVKLSPLANGKLGVIGFCYGGGIVNYLAATLGDEMSAGVPYYGVAADTASVSNIKAPLLCHLAEKDERVNETYPAFETALKAAGVAYQVFSYPGTQHGFHNNSTPRFNEEAARLSWQRTLEHFRKFLVQ